MILIIFAFLQIFKGNKYVDATFYGLRAASTAMITAAGLIVARITFLNQGMFLSLNYKTLILAVILLILTNLVKRTKELHPVVWILFSAIAGAIFEF